ncbi:hypothetical protein EW145_g57 [Phellinidium pouzarii]|uniref:Aminotransferase class I/classII large domain-containing protein n=1 Tax=Phellinidium pouzarii TaxID=167371 RepID=A0A4S4LJU2_9AGAM|nr:hypothetical protein EW145_g57 [Phellinidium pouzarii]
MLDMSQGIPGIPPPAMLLDALGRCASDPQACGYCSITGEPLLMSALAKEMKHIYGTDCDLSPDDTALTAGANMAFTAAIMAVADAGDEVVLPVPWYFNHGMTLQMMGIIAVPLPTLPHEGFLPSPRKCAELISTKTKAIVLVSPNNPTGAIYSPSLIASFALLARERNIALIMDETYRDFVTNGVPHHLFVPGPLQPSPDLPTDWTWRRHFIHLFSFSKSYCIPGHRLGAVVAGADVMEQIKTVLDCIQICAPRHVQLALYPLLPELRPFIRETAHALVQRHKLFRSLLPSTWELGSQGGYYAFVKHPFKGISATEVSRRMAVETGIVTLPAGFFMPLNYAITGSTGKDADRWIRFSVANVDDTKVEKVLSRHGRVQSTSEGAILASLTHPSSSTHKKEKSSKGKGKAVDADHAMKKSRRNLNKTTTESTLAKLFTSCGPLYQALKLSNVQLDDCFIVVCPTVDELPEMRRLAEKRAQHYMPKERELCSESTLVAPASERDAMP